jgi:hypothetical protein
MEYGLIPTSPFGHNEQLRLRLELLRGGCNPRDSQDCYSPQPSRRRYFPDELPPVDLIEALPS